MVINLYLQRMISLRVFQLVHLGLWIGLLSTQMQRMWDWHPNAFPPSLLHWCPSNLCSSTNKTSSINLTYSVPLTLLLHVLMSLDTIMIASKTFLKRIVIIDCFGFFFFFFFFFLRSSSPQVDWSTTATLSVKTTIIQLPTTVLKTSSRDIMLSVIKDLNVPLLSPIYLK